jgi:hypothetical protein
MVILKPYRYVIENSRKSIFIIVFPFCPEYHTVLVPDTGIDIRKNVQCDSDDTRKGGSVSNSDKLPREVWELLPMEMKNSITVA